tara:strand:+ start:1688 stop:2854 length:1167 start_codon:yes stop_codon:yes gene_type:complete
MSTLKVDAIRHNSATSDAITTAADGTCTAKITNNLSNRNLVINGAMQVAQRGVSNTTVSGPGYYTVDRMRYSESSLGTTVIKQEQSTDSPDGFAFSFKSTITTAEGSVGATDRFSPLNIRFEGQDFQQLQYGTSGAKSVTLSFYVKSSVTGTYNVAFYRTESTARIITDTYTINAANTWEYKTITINGDTSASITNDNANRFELFFNAGAGSDVKSTDTSGSWQNYVAPILGFGCNVNLQNTLNATWQITGVQLEVSDHASDFEHLSFGDELRRCMRYYERTYPYGVALGGSNSFAGMINQTGSSNGTGTMVVPIQYGVEKRVAPTLTAYNANNGNSGTWYVLRNGASGHNSVTIDQSSTRRARLYFSVGANWVSAAAEGHFIADAEL